MSETMTVKKDRVSEVLNWMYDVGFTNGTLAGFCFGVAFGILATVLFVVR